MKIIEKVIVEDGRELINVPASRYVLEEMGLPTEKIDEVLLESAKKDTKSNIQKFAIKTRATLAGNADMYLLASWNSKAARAERVALGNPLDGDVEILEAEAAKRGLNESADELAAKQLEKSRSLAKATAIIDGIEKSALEEVDRKRVMHTLEELVNDLKKEAVTELEKLL